MPYPGADKMLSMMGLADKQNKSELDEIIPACWAVYAYAETVAERIELFKQTGLTQKLEDYVSTATDDDINHAISAYYGVFEQAAIHGAVIPSWQRVFNILISSVFIAKRKQMMP